MWRRLPLKRKPQRRAPSRPPSRRELYLVAYDIADEKRLRAVHKTVKGFGEPLQYSVFLCALNEVQLARLKARLLDVIYARADQVLFVRLGPAQLRSLTSHRFSVLGRRMPVRDLRELVF
ncbi:MAG: CRISPR-associated endonuclease Cas2 [Firmicutes bacterium]|nr:CRISPR-associated endonuclease Cas2 [Bacillota bacterium]